MKKIAVGTMCLIITTTAIFANEWIPEKIPDKAQWGTCVAITSGINIASANWTKYDVHDPTYNPSGYVIGTQTQTLTPVIPKKNEIIKITDIKAKNTGANIWIAITSTSIQNKGQVDFIALDEDTKQIVRKYSLNTLNKKILDADTNVNWLIIAQQNNVRFTNVNNLDKYIDLQNMTENFGQSVDASKIRTIVGAKNKAFVYTTIQNVTLEKELGTLVENKSENFGQKVSINDYDIAAVADTNNDAYVFILNIYTGKWELNDKLKKNITMKKNEIFATNVKTKGNVIIVSSNMRAFVFKRSQDKKTWMLINTINNVSDIDLDEQYNIIIGNNMYNSTKGIVNLEKLQN